MYENDSTLTRDPANGMPAQAERGTAAQSGILAQRQAVQRKLADQIDGSRRQREGAARMQAMFGNGAPLQLVKDSGGKLSKKVQEEWEISPAEASRFVAWCKSAEEVDDWLIGQTYEEWQTLQEIAPDEHDPEKIADILARQTAVKKTIAPRKTQPVESDADRQMRLAQEYEDRRAAERRQLAQDRTARLTNDNLIPTPVVFTTNALVQTVWEAAVDCYINGGNKNMSISGTYDQAVVEAAMLVWSKIQKRGLISYISRFTEVQDKSDRPDGGSNMSNLDTREVQGNFIITIDGQQMNVHVNVK